MVGVDGGDRLEDLPDRRVHRLSSLDHDRGSFAAEDLPVARALGDRDERDARGRGLGRRVQLGEPSLALGGLAPHVADLDAGTVDDPDRAAEVERPLGLVRVDVHLGDRLVARHEERVAQRLEPAVERVEIERLALDHEDRAVAVLRLLVVDRLLRQLLRDVGHLGERLARQLVEDAAHELEEPRAARIDDTGLAELVEHLGRPLDGVLAARDDPGERLGDRERTHRRQLGLLGHLADHREHRSLHGDLDRLVRARRRPTASRPPAPPRPPAACSPRTRAIPRTIVERITPEFPLASIVAARWTSAASCADVAAVERSSSATIPCIVISRFVPVSPSGTG